MQSQSDIRSNITSTIIDALKNGGLPPWRKTWSDDPNAPGLHTSMSTGNPYRGINQLLTQVSAMRQGFKSKWWGTFIQIKKNGASVSRGQKGTHVVLFKKIERKRVDEAGDEVKDNFFVMREFTVFNAEQTNGLEQFRVGFAKPQIETTERYEHADRVIAATGAEIHYGGNQAFYSLSEDFIQLPYRHQFQSGEAYYETAFHELCHWTEKRVGFDRGEAENTYAFAELVAEIGACLTMGELNLPTSSSLDNHAAYLKSWLSGMSDSRFIFKAAAQANKAVDQILSYSRSPESVAEPVEIEELLVA